MFFQVSSVGGRQVITAGGDVSGDVASELAGMIQKQFEAGHAVVIIDFSKATIIDSMGISAIVANIGLMKEKDAHLVLASCTPTVKKVLQLVGFEQHFPIVSSVEEAVRLPF